MKELKLVVPKHVEMPYTIGGTAFCWVSPMQKDRSVVQLSKFTGCKDYLHDAIHNHHCCGGSKVSNHNHCYNPGIKPVMDFRRLRLLMCISEKTSSQEQVWSGKRALNLLETKLGWKPTTIRTIKHPIEKQCYMLIGPSQWMRASFFLSVLTLVMRSCSYNPAFEADTWEEVEKTFAGWVAKNGRDANILNTTYKKMYPVLSLRNKLLKNISKKELWPPDIGFGFHNPGGFQSLCRAGSYSSKINDAFNRLSADYKI